MSNIPTLPQYPPHLEALFQQLDPSKQRLIFGVDATASRQPVWDMAAKLTAQMFQTAAANGGLELQLIHYRGERECVASRWMSDARALTANVERHVPGRPYPDWPRHGARAYGKSAQENRRLVLISDACEEIPAELYAAARRLGGVPVFLFQEGDDEQVAEIYRTIASITGGASCRFDAGAAARLADLLRAVAAFATGGARPWPRRTAKPRGYCSPR